MPTKSHWLIVSESHSLSLILTKVALIVAALMIVKVFLTRQSFFFFDASTFRLLRVPPSPNISGVMNIF